MRRFIPYAFLVILLLTLQGCLLAGTALLIAAGTKESAQRKTEMEMKTKYLKEYNSYRIEMEKLNLERERQKIKPQEILSFNAWLDTLALPPKDRELLIGPPPKATSPPPKAKEEQKAEGVEGAGTAPASATGN